jgi:Lsr2
MPPIPPAALGPVTQHRNPRVCRSDAERVQMTWRSSSCGAHGARLAQKVTDWLEDDLDGGQADETVWFGLGGVDYEIDLSMKNVAAFRNRGVSVAATCFPSLWACVQRGSRGSATWAIRAE